MKDLTHGLISLFNEKGKFFPILTLSSITNTVSLRSIFVSWNSSWVLTFFVLVFTSSRTNCQPSAVFACSHSSIHHPHAPNGPQSSSLAISEKRRQDRCHGKSEVSGMGESRTVSSIPSPLGLQMLLQAGVNRKLMMRALRLL